MKTLILIRHAKSSWDDPYLDDFERPLNQRGTRDLPKMAARFRSKYADVNYFIASPANRALTTAKAFAEGKENTLMVDKSLYHASYRNMISTLRQVANKLDQIALVGHNPGLTGLCNHLLRDEYIDNIPTTGIVVLSLPIKSWNEISAKSASLIEFDYPKKS